MKAAQIQCSKRIAISFFFFISSSSQSSKQIRIIFYFAHICSPLFNENEIVDLDQRDFSVGNLCVGIHKTFRERNRFSKQTIKRNIFGYEPYDTRRQSKEAHHENFKIYHWAKKPLAKEKNR